MQVTLLAFRQNLEDLTHYLRTLEMESELLAKKITSNPPSDVEGALRELKNHLSRSTTKRRFDYNSVIVSLYGFLEQYIESLLRAYAEAINTTIPKYELLPEQIRKQHIELSYTLIKRIEQTRYKTSISIPQIIANLHSCMSNSPSYKINSDAFAYHSANFRMEIINQSFANLGITNVPDKVKGSQIFKDYLTEIEPEREVSSVTNQEAFSMLNDLADRRNDVAHGIDSDILSNNILLDYIKFFQIYGSALYHVVRRETLPYVAKHQAIELGSAIMVVNNNVVCLSLNNVRIKIGDVLLAKTPDGTYYDGEIQEIQIDRVPYSEVPPSPSVNVGIRVPFSAKQNQMFMLLPQDSTK